MLSDLFRAGRPQLLSLHEEAILEGLTQGGTLVLSAMHQEVGDPHTRGGRPRSTAALRSGPGGRQRWGQLPQTPDHPQTP